jgi:pimeloyl-ACP methyl ester carboxylesterase
VKSVLLRALRIALLVYLGFGALLYLAQRSLLYLPVAENPADGYPVEYLASDGVRLKLWVINPGQADAVVYFGGNAEDVYLNAGDFAAWLPGRTVYLVNYRGYGGSGGVPSEAALFADALRLFDHLADRHRGIAAIGRSLGSGVATYLASRRPVERLVLVTPHDSAVAVARRIYPLYPVDWLLKDRYESVRHARGVSAPVLLLLAAEDRIIPREHSQRLAGAFVATTVEQVVIDRAGHNGISGRQRYWEAIRGFLRAQAAR